MLVPLFSNWEMRARNGSTVLYRLGVGDTVYFCALLFVCNTWRCCSWQCGAISKWEMLARNGVLSEVGDQESPQLLLCLLSAAQSSSSLSPSAPIRLSASPRSIITATVLSTQNLASKIQNNNDRKKYVEVLLLIFSFINLPKKSVYFHSDHLDSALFGRISGRWKDW